MEKLDETKALLVIIFKDESEWQQYVGILSKLNFAVPFGFNKVECVMLPKNENLAAACNFAIKNTDAKYKLFLTKPMVFFDSLLIVSMLDIFFTYPNVGMVGLFGSEMPISGDYRQAKSIYGRYYFSQDGQNMQGYFGKVPLFYQSVHMLDEGFFAMSGDILFDEEMGEGFVMAAQCCQYRRAGYDIGVIYYEAVGIIFLEDRCTYYVKNIDAENYQKQLDIFREKYKDIVTPLVSICIPTYNQPIFCEVALQSALTQNYPNIEIIIGDDSTNEDTKIKLEPYLQKYSNIQYFYHGGTPLRKKGGSNITFTINKSSGEYINVLFHDDAIAVDKISRMMDYFISDLENEIVLAVSARILINENNQIISRFNEWQSLNDEIVNGEDVGRKILFSKRNFLGELSTSLIKKSSLLSRDPETGEEIFDIGIFCGVQDAAYGDIGTWLNLLKYGGKCVFIKDTLNAFRQHPAQNTYNHSTRVRLMIEFLGYINIAWLNNIYLHNYDEYKFCLKTWVIFFDIYCPPVADDESEDIKFLRETMQEARSYIVEEKFPEVLDCSVRFLLDVLEAKNSIRPLIRQNKKTGLYEKADDGIVLDGEQRC